MKTRKLYAPSVEEIKERLEEKGISAYKVEKLSGIGRAKVLRLLNGGGVAYLEAKKIIEAIESHE
jgi:nitrogen regulatory protein PII